MKKFDFYRFYKIIGLVCLLYCIELSQCHRSDVYIAGFFPYGQGKENSEVGRGVMPSVKLALDHVNEHSDILANYRLHMWWNDTQCNAAVGVKSFFDMMHSGPHKLMLFGAACTHVTDPIAKASKHWHLTQLSYADTHPMFTRDAFPNFFRVVPSENAFNAPRMALLKAFNWTRIGTIYQNEPRFSLPHNHLVAVMDSENITVLETQSFVADVNDSLQKLREKDVRIILGNFNEYWARRIFCQAYHLQMYGRSYQWLIMGTYSLDWWMKENDTINCTSDQLKKALDATILTDLLPLSTTGDITIAGITANEYLTEYNSRRGREYSRFHGYTYDGIWAAALAIQYVAKRREHITSKFEYRVKDWENIFLDALRNTSFEGVTGPVRFYNNERRANILLKQFQFDKEVKIGEFNSIENKLMFESGEPLKWIGRSPPKDQTVRIIERSQVNLTIYAILASCSVLGIFMASVFLGFNVKYRNQRYIKMSSPHLNNLIILGCMCTYLSVIFLGLDSGLSGLSAFPYVCTARAWLLMAGFSLAFGAMFSKTWRVHSIFTDVKLNKKVIKDYQLFMVVGILLAIDIVIMLTWQFADPFYRDTKQIEPVHHPSLEDVLIVQENEYCQSSRITIFIGVIYAYKGILLIFGAFLAWETRHVSIPALNDSKHIGLSVYNVLIMCIMGAAIALVLADRRDAVFILISVFIIFCTTATLCFVFVPKVRIVLYEMRRNPQGVVDKRIRATLRPMSKNRRDSSVCELEQRLRDVKTNNCRFRKALLEKEAELQGLIRKLGPEARAWIDGTTDSEPLLNRPTLSVPIVRRDMPSATDVTDMTSVGSLTSTHDSEHVTTMADGKNSIQPTDLQQLNVQMMSAQKSQQLIETNNNQPLIDSSQKRRLSRSQENNIVDKTSLPMDNHAKSPNDSHYLKNKTLQSPVNRYKELEEKTIKNRSQLILSSLTHSNTELNSICPHKGSTKNLNQEQHRRVSVGAAMKGNFVVSQSDLWDTHTLSHAKQRQSPRNHPNPQRCQEHAHSVPHEQNNLISAPIQRSVSEKNRTKHRHKPKTLMGQSETDSERERERENRNPTTPQRKLAKSIQHSHHHSSPNVAPEKQRKHRNSKAELYGASSESELLDGDTAILPIFRKLLTEKQPRYRRNNVVGASCPNISIKCDIVEYL
ncbi:gamma-aminobutyric acid type B receptor subunit 2 isoform X1 [Contarinia nasturtii]|uniref:gamma-aminobutyric acid type B receptor subunit 2 isoform X1 n=1 Tax=Contarinia nasturtii TaxID=265458 RepID=UPI0012D37DB9|nr:gamma-aminobutyric acid type B receptor subunit 2 isoform X1 [Contarinia nasturtii]